MARAYVNDIAQFLDLTHHENTRILKDKNLIWNGDWLIYSKYVVVFRWWSVVTFVLQGFFVVVQHFSILLCGRSVQTFLIVFVGRYCSFVCDELEDSVKHALCRQEGHEVLDWSIRPNWNVESVEPERVVGCFDVCFVFDSFLFCFDGCFFFCFLSWVPEVGIDGSESNEKGRSSKLCDERDTGPSLLTDLARY